jgi:hypothetical protein
MPRSRRRPVAPGSLADRIRTAAPARVGATMDQIVAQALALPEDVKAEVNKLRRSGHLRTWGQTRARKYFWSGRA